MCGIVGILSGEPVSKRLFESLQRLEYRGYDSCGVATLLGGQVQRRRASGKLANLAELLAKEPIAGTIGIGHTRWATHGAPTVLNAHPHASEQVAVVHNGIIENFLPLRLSLEAKGHIFETQTDTEVLVHLVHEALKTQKVLKHAVQEVISQLHGAFAAVFLFAGHEHELIAVSRGAPLVVGWCAQQERQAAGQGEYFIGSDTLAIAPYVNYASYLEDGDLLICSHQGITFHDIHDQIVTRATHEIQSGSLQVDRGNYEHFMAKEIHEQPDVVGRTLSHYLDLMHDEVKLPAVLPMPANEISRIHVVACGTAYLAGCVARQWFEQYAGVPLEVDIASEFRYRHALMGSKSLMLLVSQSGETADTLACLRYAKQRGIATLGVVNVPNSSIARESDCVLPTLAGPEIGVASTKAFTCQLAVLACLALHLGRVRGVLTVEQERQFVRELVAIPGLMAEILTRKAQIDTFAKQIAQASDALYLGRGMSFPLALEGALKLKEITYMHAEGYAAGELKHGPIALVDEHKPVVVLAPKDEVFYKTLSNVQEVAARGGQLFVIGDAEVEQALSLPMRGFFAMPQMPATFAALAYALPMQLLAYYTAVAMGRNVDQPRNLAKSVTVE